MIDIRTEIRDAFEREQSAFPPPAALRAQVVAEVSAHARASAPARPRAGRDLSWLMGAAAILLAIAIVAGLLLVRWTNSHQTPVRHGPGSQLCIVGPTRPSDRFATVHGYITYSDGSEIWAVDPNHPAGPTSLGRSYWTPVAWSRDGRHMLLRTAGHDNFSEDLCVINADGSQTRLTSDGLANDGTFSADSTKVIFSRAGGLFAVDPRGGTPQLIAKPNLMGSGSFALSPDGSRIAYIVDREITQTYEIWTVDLDGADPRHLFDYGQCCSPNVAWSPDGSMLAIGSRDAPLFASGLPPTSPPLSETWAIYTVSADGSGLRRINEDGEWPSWSPDGSRIAFTRGPDLFTMAPDGSTVTLVEGVLVAPGYRVVWNPAVSR